MIQHVKFPALCLALLVTLTSAAQARTTVNWEWETNGVRGFYSAGLNAKGYLLSALAACPDDQPCVVRLLPGVYPHTSIVDLRNLTNVTIFADGVIFEIPAGPIDCTDIPWIRLMEPNRVRISGLTIIDLGTDSAKCHEQTHGITTRGGFNLRLDHLRISNVGDECIQIGATEWVTIEDSEFDRCVREFHAWAGSIVVHGSRDVLIQGNRFHDNLTAAELATRKNQRANGIRVEASSVHGTTTHAIRVLGNKFDRLFAGVVVAAANDVEGILIDGNMFQQVTRPISVRSFGGTITELEIGTNVFIDSGPVRIPTREPNP